MKIAIPSGLFDIVPTKTKQPWQQIELWQYVEASIRSVAEAFAYREIRVPIFERTELFQRSVGEETDIVSKEMYTFEDRGGRSMTLRPEGTASVMRSFITNAMQNEGSHHRLFYFGPMFRYERPQAGRYRQHHQFGVEVVGAGTAAQDAEIIDLLYTIYKQLGLKNLRVCLNSLGDSESRANFRAAFCDYLNKYVSDLSDDSQRRFETNPLRILDSKDANDQKILEEAPKLQQFLSRDASAHFDAVQSHLDWIELPYTVTDRLVRGLDYYNQTVFEVVSEDLGAQNSLGGGGRYDGLLKMLGGPDLPTAGFATGLERVVQAMINQGVAEIAARGPELFLIALGEEAHETAFRLLHRLRNEGIACQMELSKRKLKPAMQMANQLKAEFVTVLGSDEVKKQEVELKRMADGEKAVIRIEELVQHFKRSKSHV